METNQVFRSSYSFSKEYLLNNNTSIDNIIDIARKSNNTIVLNDNNLFGYAELLKAVPIDKTVVISYSLDDNQSIVFNSIEELKLFIERYNFVSSSNDVQSFRNKASTKKTDVLNLINDTILQDTKFCKLFNFYTNSELKNFDFSNINKSIHQVIHNLNYDDFCPDIKDKIDLPYVLKKMNLKLGYTENDNYDSIREKLGKEYLLLINEDEKLEFATEASKQLSFYKQYVERLIYEMDVFNCGNAGKQDFRKYIEMVSFMVKMCKSNNYSTGPGRGSAAGSLVLYALDIVDLDPIEYQLSFDRFLNASRNNLPDVDIDFSSEARQFLVNELQKRGLDVFKIQTMSKQNITTLVENLVLDKQGNKALFNKKDDKNIYFGIYSLLKTLKNNENIHQQFSENFSAMFQSWMQMQTKNNPCFLNVNKKQMLIDKINEINQQSRTFNGTSVHASAHIIIDNKNLKNLFTIEYDKSGNKVLQVSASTLEKLGATKHDLLILSTLDVIDKTKKDINIDLINCNYTALNSELCNLETKKVISLLQNEFNSTLFQVNSFRFQCILSKCIKEWEINNNGKTLIEVISDIIAIVRPGVVKNGVDIDYVESFTKEQSSLLNSFSKNGEIFNKVKSVVPTGNVIYQEEVMAIAQAFGVANPDNFRRAISKKDNELMEKAKIEFLDSALKQNSSYDIKELNGLFTNLAKYSEYCFNKSHSLSYAKLLLDTAYLKSNYPVQYLQNYIDDNIKDLPKVVQSVQEAVSLGVNVAYEDCLNSILINSKELKQSKGVDNEKIINTAVFIAQNNGYNISNKIKNNPQAHLSYNNDIVTLINDDKEILNDGHIIVEVKNGDVLALNGDKLPLKPMDFDLKQNKLPNGLFIYNQATNSIENTPDFIEHDLQELFF